MAEGSCTLRLDEPSAFRLVAKSRGIGNDAARQKGT